MLILSLVLLPLCAAGRAPPRATKQPNFVLLFLDDHGKTKGSGSFGDGSRSVAGFGDFGLNAPFTATTPHMNALASRGVHFLDMHCGASVCTPSRAALLTGRYGTKHSTTTLCDRLCLRCSNGDCVQFLAHLASWTVAQRAYAGADPANGLATRLT